jgi:putative acetyltransferase
VDIVIATEPPTGDDVLALLTAHLTFARATSPSCHVHALDLDGLRAPEITFFAARRGDELLGVGALKALDGDSGELKSMHTNSSARGGGVGAALVEHLLDTARQRSYTRVSLETGTQDEFAPARRLYARLGFTPCAPFGEYTENPYSTCMSIELQPT